MRYPFLQIIYMLAVLLMLGGCTSTALQRSTISDARSVREFVQEMVLDNVAMMVDSPGSIPWHVNIVKGTATIGDNASAGISGKWPNAVQTYSISGSRVWQGDWTLSPVLDTNILTQLYYKYTDIAEEAITQTNTFWLHAAQNSMIPPALFLHGSHGLAHVWVAPKDYGQLENLTMEILDLTSPLVYFTSNNIDPKQMVIVLTNSKPGTFWNDILTNLSSDASSSLKRYLKQDPHAPDIRVENDFKQQIAKNLNIMLSNLTTERGSQNVLICSREALVTLIANTRNPATRSLLRYNLGELDALGKRDRTTLQVLQLTVAKLNAQILLYGFENQSPFLIGGSLGGGASGGYLESPAYGGQLLQ